MPKYAEGQIVTAKMLDGSTEEVEIFYVSDSGYYEVAVVTDEEDEGYLFDLDAELNEINEE